MGNVGIEAPGSILSRKAVWVVFPSGSAGDRVGRRAARVTVPTRLARCREDRVESRRPLSFAILVNPIASASPAEPILTLLTDSLALSSTTTRNVFEAHPECAVGFGGVLNFSPRAAGRQNSDLGDSVLGMPSVLTEYSRMEDRPSFPSLRRTSPL